jgi:hypothetical protein
MSELLGTRHSAGFKVESKYGVPQLMSRMRITTQRSSATVTRTSILKWSTKVWERIATHLFRLFYGPVISPFRRFIQETCPGILRQHMLLTCDRALGSGTETGPAHNSTQGKPFGQQRFIQGGTGRAVEE